MTVYYVYYALKGLFIVAIFINCILNTILNIRVDYVISKCGKEECVLYLDEIVC